MTYSHSRRMTWRIAARKSLHVTTAVAFFLGSLAPLEAAVTGGPSVSTSSGQTGFNQNDVLILAFDKRDTKPIVRNIQSVNKECSTYKKAYRIDCLAKGLDAVADRVRNRPDYLETKSELRRASAKLKKIVAKFEDGKAEVLPNKPKVNPRLKKRRKIRAVKKAARKKAMAEARKVIKETETRLLRASENASRRKAHYAQLAKAVGSTKVLLRS